MVFHSQEQLKKGIALVVLAGFLSLAAFSMGGMHVNHSGSCVAATLQNTACPNTLTLSALVFHLGAWKNVVQLAPATLLAAVVFVALALTIMRRGGGPFASTTQLNHSHYRVAATHRRVPLELRMTHWLALREASPSLVSLTLS